MISDWSTFLIVGGLIAAAINGGAFFALSNFVMPALAAEPTGNAVSAMQSINIKAPNPIFVVSIVGAGLIGVPVVVAEADRFRDASTQFLGAGVALSLMSFAITMVFNVPRNNALDRLNPAAERTAIEWADYVTSWTRANTLRMATSLTSVACYALYISI